MTSAEAPRTKPLIISVSIQVRAPAKHAFAPIGRIGGETGWYYANWLWQLRGFVDGLLGGAGMRRDQRDSKQVKVGDVIDFWRVEAIEPDRRLRLLGEMRLPGRAWLEFEVTPEGENSIIKQTAIFDPRGLPGLIYWYGLYPIHWIIFVGTLRRIGDAAEAGAGAYEDQTTTVE